MKKSTAIVILLTSAIIAAGFSIILMKDGTKILSDNGIDSYNISSHELILKEVT